MESSGEQALLIGVNVFILIIALTCAIMLMVTVLNMSNAANTVIKTTTSSSLMTLYGGTNERIYTGEQVIATIEEYNSPTTNMKERMVLKLKSGDTETEIVEGFNQYNQYMLDAKYNLKYYGKVSDKDVYVVERIM